MKQMRALASGLVQTLADGIDAAAGLLCLLDLVPLLIQRRLQLVQLRALPPRWVLLHGSTKRRSHIMFAPVSHRHRFGQPKACQMARRLPVRLMRMAVLRRCSLLRLPWRPSLLIQPQLAQKRD